MRIAIIGAGLGGLAAACDLADRGHAVTIFERRPWAGGKTYSFIDKETGEAIDNGQHVFMGCTEAYVAFLRKLGTLDLTKRQSLLRVPVFDRAGRRSDLWSAPVPAPFHLLQSFATYRHLSAAEKVRIARALIAIRRLTPSLRAEQDEQSFGTWLRQHGQKGSEIRRFWDLIAVPTLNCSSERASAAQALFVFQEGFLKSARSAAIGLPAVGLSELHVLPAIRYVEGRGGEVRTRARVERLECDRGKVAALVLEGGERCCFEAYVAALPPRQLLDILPAGVEREPAFAGLRQFECGAIVTLHLWYAGPVADFDFAAFTGSAIQWIFNRTRIGRTCIGRGERQAGSAEEGDHLVVSLSNASRYVELSKSELAALLLPQLEQALPRSRSSRLLRFLVVKEPEATFVPAPGLQRPTPETPFENLFLAGAHTATGWPATMESAVRSGTAAAAALTARAPALRQREVAAQGPGREL